jgi:hypothetical protein
MRNEFSILFGTGTSIRNNYEPTSVTDLDPVFFLPPGSGMNFFRISAPGSRIFLTMTKTLLLKAKEARKKVSLHSTFHVGSGIRNENVWIRIRDEKMVGSESGIQDKTFWTRKHWNQLLSHHHMFGPIFALL